MNYHSSYKCATHAGEVVAVVAKSPVALAEDELPIQIATGATQSPVAVAATPFAASTTMAMTGRDELRRYVLGNCKQKTIELIN
jgi:hypothetical protein